MLVVANERERLIKSMHDEIDSVRQTSEQQESLRIEPKTAAPANGTPN